MDGSTAVEWSGSADFPRLVVTINSNDSIADFVKKHGDGVKDIALSVKDVPKAYSEAISRGGIPIQEPHTLSDENGTIVKAIIGTYGDSVHTLIDRQHYKGLFAPSYKTVEFNVPHISSGLIGIDHVVGNVERMDEWVSYYEKVMDFKQMIHFDDEDISTEYSALMSKVMHNGGRIKFPINEPGSIFWIRRIRTMRCCPHA